MKDSNEYYKVYDATQTTVQLSFKPTIDNPDILADIYIYIQTGSYNNAVPAT